MTRFSEKYLKYKKKYLKLKSGNSFSISNGIKKFIPIIYRGNKIYYFNEKPSRGIVSKNSKFISCTKKGNIKHIVEFEEEKNPITVSSGRIIIGDEKNKIAKAVVKMKDGGTNYELEYVPNNMNLIESYKQFHKGYELIKKLSLGFTLTESDAKKKVKPDGYPDFFSHLAKIDNDNDFELLIYVILCHYTNTSKKFNTMAWAIEKINKHRGDYAKNKFSSWLKKKLDDGLHLENIIYDARNNRNLPLMAGMIADHIKKNYLYWQLKNFSAPSFNYKMNSEINEYNFYFYHYLVKIDDGAIVTNFSSLLLGGDNNSHDINYSTLLCTPFDIYNPKHVEKIINFAFPKGPLYAYAIIFVLVVIKNFDDLYHYKYDLTNFLLRALYLTENVTMDATGVSLTYYANSIYHKYHYFDNRLKYDNSECFETVSYIINMGKVKEDAEEQLHILEMVNGLRNVIKRNVDDKDILLIRLAYESKSYTGYDNIPPNFNKINEKMKNIDYNFTPPSKEILNKSYKLAATSTRPVTILNPLMNLYMQDQKKYFVLSDAYGVYVYYYHTDDQWWRVAIDSTWGDFCFQIDEFKMNGGKKEYINTTFILKIDAYTLEPKGTLYGPLKERVVQENDQTYKKIFAHDNCHLLSSETTEIGGINYRLWNNNICVTTDKFVYYKNVSDDKFIYYMQFLCDYYGMGNEFRDRFTTRFIHPHDETIMINNPHLMSHKMNGSINPVDSRCASDDTLTMISKLTGLKMYRSDPEQSALYYMKSLKKYALGVHEETGIQNFDIGATMAKIAHGFDNSMPFDEAVKNCYNVFVNGDKAFFLSSNGCLMNATAYSLLDPSECVDYIINMTIITHFAPLCVYGTFFIYLISKNIDEYSYLDSYDDFVTALLKTADDVENIVKGGLTNYLVNVYQPYLNPDNDFASVYDPDDDPPNNNSNLAFENENENDHKILVRDKLKKIIIKMKKNVLDDDNAIWDKYIHHIGTVESTLYVVIWIMYRMMVRKNHLEEIFYNVAINGKDSDTYLASASSIIAEYIKKNNISDQLENLKVPKSHLEFYLAQITKTLNTTEEIISVHKKEVKNTTAVMQKNYKFSHYNGEINEEILGDTIFDKENYYVYADVFSMYDNARSHYEIKYYKKGEHGPNTFIYPSEKKFVSLDVVDDKNFIFYMQFLCDYYGMSNEFLDKQHNLLEHPKFSIFKNNPHFMRKHIGQSIVAVDARCGSDDTLTMIMKLRGLINNPDDAEKSALYYIDSLSKYNAGVHVETGIKNFDIGVTMGNIAGKYEAGMTFSQAVKNSFGALEEKVKTFILSSNGCLMNATAYSILHNNKLWVEHIINMTIITHFAPLCVYSTFLIYLITININEYANIKTFDELKTALLKTVNDVENIEGGLGAHLKTVYDKHLNGTEMHYDINSTSSKNLAYDEGVLVIEKLRKIINKTTPNNVWDQITDSLKGTVESTLYVVMWIMNKMIVEEKGLEEIFYIVSSNGRDCDTYLASASGIIAAYTRKKNIIDQLKNLKVPESHFDFFMKVINTELDPFYNYPLVTVDKSVKYTVVNTANKINTNVPADFFQVTPSEEFHYLAQNKFAFMASDHYGKYLYLLTRHSQKINAEKISLKYIDFRVTIGPNDSSPPKKIEDMTFNHEHLRFTIKKGVFSFTANDVNVIYLPNTIGGMMKKTFKGYLTPNTDVGEGGDANVRYLLMHTKKIKNITRDGSYLYIEYE